MPLEPSPCQCSILRIVASDPRAAKGARHYSGGSPRPYLSINEHIVTSISQDAHWTTRPDRHPVKLNGMAKLRDGSGTSVQIRDLSNSGCLLETEHTLPVDEIITLSLPHGVPLHAHVRWAVPGKYGASFLTTIWDT